MSRINWTRYLSGDAGAFPPKNWPEFIRDVASLETTSFAGGKYKRAGSTTLRVDADTIAASVIDFTVIDKSDGDGAKVGIYSGRISDTTNGGLSWPADGLTDGEFTAVAVGDGDTNAWLEISYTEGLPANITDVSFDTGAAVPGNESGVLYVPLAVFSVSGGKVTIGSSPIGSQAFDAWRLWFANPATYSAECNPL